MATYEYSLGNSLESDLVNRLQENNASEDDFKVVNTEIIKSIKAIKNVTPIIYLVSGKHKIVIPEMGVYYSLEGYNRDTNSVTMDVTLNNNLALANIELLGKITIKGGVKKIKLKECIISNGVEFIFDNNTEVSLTLIDCEVTSSFIFNGFKVVNIKGLTVLEDDVTVSLNGCKSDIFNFTTESENSKLELNNTDTTIIYMSDDIEQIINGGNVIDIKKPKSAITKRVYVKDSDENLDDIKTDSYVTIKAGSNFVCSDKSSLQWVASDYSGLQTIAETSNVLLTVCDYGSGLIIQTISVLPNMSKYKRRVLTDTTWGSWS